MKKKVKRYQNGGLAGIAQSAEDLMSNVDSMANTINYGSGTVGSATQPVGFEVVSGVGAGMKKGGSVKSSASKRADGIAIRGKTRA
jgi:hypothetical protein